MHVTGFRLHVLSPSNDQLLYKTGLVMFLSILDVVDFSEIPGVTKVPCRGSVGRDRRHLSPRGSGENKVRYLDSVHRFLL